MQWFIMLCGLLLLVMLRRTKKTLPPPEQTSLSYSELMTALAETSRIEKGYGYARIPRCRGLLRQLEKHLRRPNCFENALLTSETKRLVREKTAQAVVQCRKLPRLPKAKAGIPRLCLFLQALIRFEEPITEELLQEAIAVWQKQTPMTEDELNALPPLLYRMLVQQLCDRNIQSLISVSQISWQHLLEEASTIHRMLSQDPTYLHSDGHTQAFCRQHAALIARRCHRSERSVCSAVIALCRSADASSVRACAGYYLHDDGCRLLLSRMNALSPLYRLRLWTMKHFWHLIRILSWIFFICLLAAGFFSGYAILMLIPFAFVFLIAVQNLLLRLFHSRLHPFVPRIALDHLPDDCPVLAVCFAVLKDPSHAVEMAKKISAMHEANPDKNLHFMLLGDFQDSLTATAAGDAPIITAASTAVDLLKSDTGHPFFYLQRSRTRLPGGQTFHGKARRHGALNTLLCLLNGRSVHDIFAYSNVDPASLFGKYRYIIALDEDTFLPPGSVLDLVGTMLHPLQKRRKLNGRMRGISMLHPFLQSSPHRMKTLFSRMINAPLLTETDAVGHSGIGIIDISAYFESTHVFVPRSSLLNASSLESTVAGCAADSSILLSRQPPQHLSDHLNNQHLRIRSLWQTMPYMLPLPGNRLRKRPEQRTRSLFWHSLCQSLTPSVQLLLMLYATLTGRNGLLAALTFLPQSALLFPFSFSAVKRYLMQIAILPYEAFVQADAILRTMYQLMFRRPQLIHLPLETSRHQPSMLLFTISMSFAGFFAGLPLLFNGAWFGLIPALFWAAFPFLSPVLEQSILSTRPTEYMRGVLGQLAQRTFAFFETFITDKDHGLPPVRVQIEPNTGLSHVTSPQSIGLYLCSLIAAHRLALISDDELGARMQEAVHSMETLPKWNGLFHALYDTQALLPASMDGIPSEACGVLAVCLLTCAQGLRTVLSRLKAEYHDLPFRLDQLCSAMQLDKLYDSEADLFFTDVNPVNQQPSDDHHDLLTSESRLLSYAAIMLHKVPLRHWKQLGRPKDASGALLSRYGAMSEYLLPMLFMPSARHTFLDHSARRMLCLQRRHRLDSAFGISTCECHALDSSQHYQSRPFGIPELALDPQPGSAVLSPCASMLCLPLDTKAAFRNLQRLQQLGLEGPLGLFEAADFSPARTGGKTMAVVRSHTAYHQGMILCAVCNTLCDGYISNLFSNLPQAQAFRILLDEPCP